VHLSGDVIVGVDGSDQSAEAAAWALKELRGTEHGLRLVHVVTPAHLEIDDEADLRETGTSVLADLRTRLEELDRSHPDGAAGPRIDTEVVVGDAAEELTQRADDAGLLVLGRHGAGRVNSRRIGTVSFGLPGHALSAVLVHTVTAGSEFDEAAHPARDGGRIVVGLDTSEYSHVAAQDAAALAVRSGWTLHVLVAPDTLGGRDATHAGAEAAVDWLHEDFPDLAIELEELAGDPARLLLAASETADLVVLGKRGAGVFAGMTSQLGRTSSAVLTDAASSVLLVPYRRDERLRARLA
jgi:nucleotide-binding universal stress UspA family protein